MVALMSLTAVCCVSCNPDLDGCVRCTVLEAAIALSDHHRSSMLEHLASLPGLSVQNTELAPLLALALCQASRKACQNPSIRGERDLLFLFEALRGLRSLCVCHGFTH
jgi:hypothetical protein